MDTNGKKPTMSRGLVDRLSGAIDSGREQLSGADAGNGHALDQRHQPGQWRGGAAQRHCGRGGDLLVFDPGAVAALLAGGRRVADLGKLAW